MFEQINLSRRRFLGRAALTIGVVGSGMIATAKTRSGEKGELASLVGATTWLNSQPLTPAELDGKVVLVDFWTYSCINWRRQLPYLRAWAEKYKDHGLIVIGVHSPEFSFEKNIENVRWAIKDMRMSRDFDNVPLRRH
jgi:thiol-disulfide isomerase/thioredoxin